MLLEQVKMLYNNLKPEALMEMPATREQSKWTDGFVNAGAG